MVRVMSGAMLVAITAMVLSIGRADPHQSQDVVGGERNSADQFGPGGPKTRNLDSLGGGNLIRQVRESHRPRDPIPLPYEYTSPFGLKRELWRIMSPIEFGGYFGDGLPKRNFDEIDRSGLDNFVKKRNFDEIDQTSMPFPYSLSKRVVKMFRTNNYGHGESSYDKKRNRADFPMDEIDLSHFPIGSKRSFEDYPLAQRLLY